MNESTTVRRRHIIQWFLMPIVIVTIGLGWKYPLLGFSVPAVMLAGMIGGIIRGRYVCGNLCPRGSFFDRLMTCVSRKKPIPEFLISMAFRWVLFAALMGFMVFSILQNPTDIRHWGHVFWLMCVVTTGIGVVLGILIHPRSWCAFCPMGTMQNALGGGKHQLRIDSETCVECKDCEKACPFGLSIAEHKNDGNLPSRDCLKCSECIAVCPKSALSWPRRD